MNISAVTLTIDPMSESAAKRPPFDSLFQALAFFRSANPARLKPLNLIEPERRGDDFETRTGMAPSDAWAAVCLALKCGLIGLDTKQRRLFELFHLDERVKAQAGMPEIARALHLTEKDARRLLRKAREHMTDMLFRRGIIPQPVKWD